MRFNNILTIALLFTPPAMAQSAEVAVIAKPVSRTIELPAELLPYQSVSIHARVQGYVERILVDRGSVVKQGQLIAELSAPEMQARITEAESRVEAAEADRLQAEAQLSAARATAERLKRASQTVGAIAGNELVQAQAQVDAAQAALQSREHAKQVAQAGLRTQQDLIGYLKITAPFDGVVTERFVHPGALVGPTGDAPLVTIQQVTRLRLVVPVPEEDLSGMATGGTVSFKVPAIPDRVYSATVARRARVLDSKTRAMSVELDVFNRDGSLAPGMYPSVKWPVRSGKSALFVPKTSVVTTTERTFVIRNQAGRAEWVDVKKGAADGDNVEVSGNLRLGDKVLRRGTDEVRDGSPLKAAAK